MDIYISGLDVKVTDETLNLLFSKHGLVDSSTVMVDGFTGYSRGFAFVVMPNEDEAINAIAALDGSLIEGRPVVVKESKLPLKHKGSYAIRNKS
jgi:RNA recognition motif-containing protein